MQTPAYRDMLIDGIFPDGTVDWVGSGIARGLREAVSMLILIFSTI